MTSRGSVGLLIAVLAALGVGTWLAVSAAGGRTALRAAAPRAPAAGGAGTDDAMTPVVRGEPRSGAPRGEVAPLPVAPAVDERGFEIEAAPEDAIEVLVRVSGTKEPVPGAIVLCADWTMLTEEEQAMLWWGDEGLIDGLERVGRRFRADEAGVVRIPRPSEGGFATCEHGELFGQLDLDSDPSGRRTLELAPDVVIRARVVDAAGTPVEGIPVGLRVVTQWWSWDILKAVTGADGIATLEHAQAPLAQQGDPSQRFAVGVVMHAAEPVQVELDRKALPTEPIELRVPPHGSVEVILDPPGNAGNAREPAARNATVFLQETGREEEHYGYQTWSPRRLEDGRTVFPIVGLGLRFLAHAESPDVEVEPQEFGGPGSAGERVVVHLSPGAAKPRIVGRALLADGTPLAEERLRGTIQYLDLENDWTAGFTAATDTDGRFSANVGMADGPAAPGAVELELEHDKLGKLAGSVPLAGRLLPGDNPVGDVRLAPPPLLASGRVVDQAGNGIRGARVSLESASEQREVMLGYAGSGTGSVRHWGGVWGFSSPDGSFEVRGEMADDLYRVTASHSDYRSLESLEVRRGASVILTLAGAGRIAGRFQGDPDVSIANVQLQVLDASGVPVESEERRQNDGVSFELLAVPPGSYTVLALLADEAAELARVDDVVVEAGRTTEDPRLDPIDLSGKLARITLRVRDRDGNPPDQLAVARRVPGSSDYGDSNWWGGTDEIVLVTAERSLDLRVEAVGSRTVELFAVSGTVDVTLGAGIPLELDLSAVRNAIGAGYGLYVEVVNLPEGQGRMDAPAQADQRGILACSVGEPGEWGVRAYVMRTDAMDPGLSTSAQIGDSLLTTIQVEDTKTAQSFVITVAPEVLEAALSELGG